MFDHVGIAVAERAASQRFYATVLRTLGLEPDLSEAYAQWDAFAVRETDDEHPVTRHLHVGFGASSREQVDAFWQAGVDAGAPDDGAPGPRTEYREDYYGAFLRDPGGNSVEAVHHAESAGRTIDHLWIRVADVAASRRFYERVGAHAGFALNASHADHAQFQNAAGSFSLVTDDRPRTADVHLAFAAGDDAAVQAFHADRAFVLDPDGHHVELVNHRRD